MMGTQASKDKRIKTALPGAGDHATGNSAFFTVLAPELRRQILTAAFGGRTMHIQTNIISARHPAGAGRSPLASREVRRHGCACYRGSDDGDVTNPATDWCVDDLVPRNHLLKQPQLPQDSLVGAVGWLQSCRLAYIEGVEVLYATNTIHIRSEALDMTMPDYIAVPHLSTITSFEFVFDQRFLRLQDFGPVPLKQLEHLLDVLPTELPRLKRLYIGFAANLAIWSPNTAINKERFQLYTERVLRPVDAMLVRFGKRLGEMEVGLPASAFQAHFHTGIGKGLKFQLPGWKPGPIAQRHPQGGYYPRQRIWRPLSPLPEQAEQSGKKRGYWVGETGNDLPSGWIIDMPRYWE
ncbi:hypothetical protein SCARD494_13047 [Seiridium cardinale]